MLKKLLALLLCICVLTSFTGCGLLLFAMEQEDRVESDRIDRDDEDDDEDEDEEQTTAPVEVVPEVQMPVVQSGVYVADNGDDTLTVESVSGDSFVFSLFWYRTYGIDNATATWNGETFVFDYQVDGDVAKGTLTFTGGEVLMTLTEADLPYIETGDTHYTFEGSEADHSGSLMLQVLLLNDEKNGWCMIIERDNTYYDNVYLRFYQGGRVDIWYLEDQITDSVVHYTEGQYTIEENRLILNGDAYILEAVGGAYPEMKLIALGEYEKDYAGEYTFSVDSYTYSGLYEYFDEFTS